MNLPMESVLDASLYICKLRTPNNNAGYSTPWIWCVLTFIVMGGFNRATPSTPQYNGVRTTQPSPLASQRAIHQSTLFLFMPAAIPTI